MEAFGAAVSILTVIQMTHKAVLGLYETHRTIKGADDDRAHIIRDLRDLERVLNRILDLVSAQRKPEDPRRDHVTKLLDYLESKDSPVTACKEEIFMIQEVLEKHKRKLSWPLRKKEIQERLQNVERYKGRLVAAMHASSMETILAVESIVHSQADMLAAHIQKESESAVLAWLRCPDVQSNLIAAVEKRQAGTGEWLLCSERFKEWLRDPQFLWLTGLPGSGKTIISSTIVATLLSASKDTDDAVVYFYFDFHVDVKREVMALLHVVLSQLALQSTSAFEELRKLYQECKDGQRQPTTEELLLTIARAASHFPRIYVVVDALDECRESHKAVEQLRRLSEAANIHVLAVSRKDADLERPMHGIPEIKLEGPEVAVDIASYVRQRVLTSEYMADWPLEEQQKVEDQLSSKADGMFRWVQCQLDAIEKCSDSDQIDEALASLPPDLPATYERILANIRRQQNQNVRKTLTCLAFGLRPFTLEEVKNVLQIDPNAEVKLSNKRVFTNQLLSGCSSLVTSGQISQGELMHHTASPELRLAHFSVKEYLLSDAIHNSPMQSFALSHAQGHREMAEACLACLIHFDNVEDFGPHTLDKFPFLSYAANNWPHHARMVNREPNRGPLDNLIFELLHGKPGAYVNWHRLCSPDSPLRGINWDAHVQEGEKRDKAWLLRRHRIRRPLYLAAMWNLWRVVEMLLRAGEDPNAWNVGNTAALHIAAAEASIESMEVLLSIGKANINQGNWIGTTALHEAAAAEDPQVVKWLLQHNANPKLSSKFQGTPLQFAAFENLYTIVDALLGNGVSPHVVYEHYHNETVVLKTPLQCAAYVGGIRSMERLIQAGVCLENHQIDCKVGTALHAAALNGQLEAAELLMAKEVDPRLKTGHYGSVLSAAAYGGSKKMVELLLDKDVPYDELREEDSHDSKAWRNMDAAERRDLVDLLISRAGDKFCPNLLEAAKQGSARMVRHFIDKGDNIEATETLHLRSPLNWAAAKGHLETVKILAEAGASVHRSNRASESPFVAACIGGHIDVAKFLLAKGAYLRQREARSRTGLMCAEMSGHTELAEFLRRLENQEKTFECEGKMYRFHADRGQCVVC
ncbi:hypothetical protein SLS56_000315 [Neofusicoccum ribis]|uniref:Nephrocystin 3-like N-terminal domain-containing protein n=1 Tax=Neofusicoccum ribis TaxID=45134 RepID=A0ABR3TDZ5_9PEZI